jgi:UDP-2-acetamido-2,6-beta-L-arabino-hexul-4-ose reductase
MNVGITGQSGFIGYHLTNYLVQKSIRVTPINKADFSDNQKLGKAIKNCDIIVHLAGVNRGPDKEVHDSNIQLASQLIYALQESNLKPSIIFSSSTQEGMDNPYGQSKKEATELFIDWAYRNNAHFTSMLIPNVFGPFGRPFYNSVISTFSYQLTHNQEPVIQVDRSLKLIYINDLVEKMLDLALKPSNEHRAYPPESYEIRVSEILSILRRYQKSYLDQNIFPLLTSQFEINLFNTFRSYIEPNHFPIKSVAKSDDRGVLIEAVKEKTGGQIFYSSTKAGKTRGNHYHRRKIERFFVIKGVGLIQIRRIGTNKKIEYTLTGEEPSYVDIPLHFVHNITNVGNENLITLFWTNELFNTQDTDTYPEQV